MRTLGVNTLLLLVTLRLCVITLPIAAHDNATLPRVTPTPRVATLAIVTLPLDITTLHFVTLSIVTLDSITLHIVTLPIVTLTLLTATFRIATLGVCRLALVSLLIVAFRVFGLFYLVFQELVQLGQFGGALLALLLVRRMVKDMSTYMGYDLET